MSVRSTKAGGFTLIELIVVISILAVVTGVVVASFAGGLRVLEAASGYSRVDAEVVSGAKLLRQDLMNAFAFYAIEFDGDASRVSFAGLERNEGSGKPRRIVNLEYALDRNTEELVRKSAVFPLSIKSPDAREESVIRGVESILFSYFEPDMESGGEWVDSWQDATNLPGAVRVRLEFGEDNPVYEFSWVRRLNQQTEAKEPGPKRAGY